MGFDVGAPFEYLHAGSLATATHYGEARWFYREEGGVIGETPCACNCSHDFDRIWLTRTAAIQATRGSDGGNIRTILGLVFASGILTLEANPANGLLGRDREYRYQINRRKCFTKWRPPNPYLTTRHTSDHSTTGRRVCDLADGGCKFQAWAVAGMSVGQFLTSVRQSCSPDRRVRGEVPARPPGLPPISKSHSDTLQRGPAD
ncbi:hypothetical protein R1flu_007938 [Riccia fluitans]|uniref:Uncharacterized protein n=1 Tax=Riccia fluitans TaxID=41844 RepID=A0ABD1XE35_9MARC